MQCQLVDRSSRQFALTPAGEATAARAAPLMAMAEDLVLAVSDRRPLEGPFHLGVIPTIAPFLLPKAAPVLKAAFPKLELYLREDLTANLLERLTAGQLDAALIALPYEATGVETADLGDDPFFFAAPPNHPLTKKDEITLRDLQRTDLLLLEDGHCLRDHAIDACKLQHPSVSGAYSATSLFTLSQMVEAGLGVTLLPKMAVDAGLGVGADLKVRPLAPPAPSRRIGLAWREDVARRDEAVLVADALRGAVV